MNDINALAQCMKAAASCATQGEWCYVRSGFNSIVQAPVTLSRGGPARVVLCKLFRSEWRNELKTAHDAAFIALANPANVVALVEALENSRAREVRWLAASNEQADIIAQLESRTIIVKRPYLPDDCDRTEAHFKYQAALTAAGIQIIEGDNHE